MIQPLHIYKELHYAHHGILDPERYAKQVTLRCYQPSPVMVPFIDCYFVARWDRPGQPNYVATDILTKPVANLFFASDKAFVSNVAQGTRRYTINEHGTFAGIKFRPGAFHAFYRQRMAQKVDKTLSAYKAIPPFTDAFAARILQIPNDHQLVHEIETVLVQQQPYVDPKIALVGDIITVIETNSHVHTASDLAAYFQMSPRTLQYLFQEYVGVGVKWMLMRHRLLATIQHALTPDKPNWTQVAAELNYSTQSHFTNEFRRLLGMSPTQYTDIILGKMTAPHPVPRITIL